MKLRLGNIVEAAVIVVLLAGTAWLGQLTYHNYVTHSRTVESRDIAPAFIPAQSLEGSVEQIAIEGRARGLLLLVLSADCPYCEQNMPEWVALVAQVRKLGPDAPEIMALSVSSADETRSYLAEHGAEVPALLVDRSVLRLLGLQGFPTTVTVDPDTRAMTAWSGVLNEAERRSLMAWADSASLDAGKRRSAIRGGATDDD